MRTFTHYSKSFERGLLKNHFKIVQMDLIVFIGWENQYKGFIGLSFGRFGFPRCCFGHFQHGLLEIFLHYVHEHFHCLFYGLFQPNQFQIQEIFVHYRKFTLDLGHYGKNLTS